MGEVPSNLPAIAWWPGWGDDDPGEDDAGIPRPSIKTSPTEVRFECQGDTEAVRIVEFESEKQDAYSIIRPTEPLVAGELCVLSVRGAACDLDAEAHQPWNWMEHDTRYLAGRASFYVSAAAPLPTSLGSFVAEPAILEPIELSEGAGCSARQNVCSIKASIAFADGTHAWKDALVYETWVDGKRWWLQRAAPLPREQGGSVLGRGRDILFAVRPGERSQFDHQGLSPGRHTVVFRARLAGTDLELATEPAEIDLDCFAASDAGTGEPDAGATPDAALPDASVPTDGGGRTPAERRRIGFSSSSCSSVPGVREGGWFVWVVLFAFGVTRMRRRTALRG